MDYSKMSDGEINIEVLAKIEPRINHMSMSVMRDCFYCCGIDGNGWHEIDIPDYCNNPADAWPIIVVNQIDIIQDNGQGCALATSSAVMMMQGEDVPSEQDVNPLRSAMIVYLMMQEGEQRAV